MPYFLSPIGNSQILDANGDPLVGGTIETYLAGTSTPAATYTDDTGGTSQGAVMTLNSLGLPTLGPVWMLGGVALKFIIKNALGVVQAPPYDDIIGIGESSGSDQWVLYGGAPTYISATSFSVDGDQTNTFQVNRRLKSTNNGGTVYSRITASVFSAGLTTVTVVNDSGVLDVGLSAVNYGLLSATNPSIPETPVGAALRVMPSVSALQAYAEAGNTNDIINGSFAVDQDVTRPTADNAFILDGWRLLLGAATAAVPVVDTADVPVGAAYALKLTVGAAPNNKFGAWSTIDTKDTLKYRGTVASVTVPLKATAGLVDGTGKIRIGIVGWTGTGNDTLTDPISAWGTEGTNPTLAAGWAFLNVPAAIAVTTAWANYSVENISVGATITNLAVMVWSDDTANTTTTDILRIGGGVTMVQAANASNPRIASHEEELAKCQRYFHKTFPMSVAPAQNAGITGAIQGSLLFVGSCVCFHDNFPVRMHAAPTIVTYNPSAANVHVRNVTAGADYSATAGTGTENGVDVISTTNGSLGNTAIVHYTASKRI